MLDVYDPVRINAVGAAERRVTTTARPATTSRPA
jgi:hypothetical protein